MQQNRDTPIYFFSPNLSMGNCVCFANEFIFSTGHHPVGRCLENHSPRAKSQRNGPLISIEFVVFYLFKGEISWKYRNTHSSSIHFYTTSIRTKWLRNIAMFLCAKGGNGISQDSRKCLSACYTSPLNIPVIVHTDPFVILLHK